MDNRKNQLKALFLLSAAFLGAWVAAQEPQRGVSFNATGILPAHTHESASSGGSTVRFVGLIRAGSSALGPLPSSTNTHVNLGNASYTGSPAADRQYGVVGGGVANTASGEKSTIGGGGDNAMLPDDGAGRGDQGTIAGGAGNRAGFGATVGGGGNSYGLVGNRAFGDWSTIPGGLRNTAIGAYSFAAGRLSSAAAVGSWAISDSENAEFLNSAADSFRARFAGGYNFTGGATTIAYIYGNGSGLSGISGETNTFTSSKTLTDALRVLGAALLNGQLNVNGASVTIRGIGAAAAFRVMVADNNVNVSLIPGGGDSASVFFDSGINGWEIKKEDAADHLQIQNEGVVDTIALHFNKTNSYVGMNTGTPLQNLDVNGSFRARSSATLEGYLLPWLRTKAQIDALAGVLGAQIVCSDCAVPYDICTGTGTGVSQWRAVMYSAISTTLPGTLVPRGCGSGN